jgi:DNA-binding LacI/PurR family transcriptional regulator
VPDDLSVATFNAADRDDGECSSLETVSIPRREVGEAAVALLLDLVRGKVRAPATRFVPYELVRGKSIGPPAGETPAGRP